MALTDLPQGPAPVDHRRAGLRRMRTIATLLLILMTAVFVATTLTRFDWPWLPYLRAFAEAGMVGACADWFAVVALFRHPLGIPIPHTGIVPANKARIGAALGRFIATNFLTAKVTGERLAEIDVVGEVARWMADPTNAERIARYVGLLLPRLIRALPGPQIKDAFAMMARQGIEAVPAAPLASRLLAIAWAQGEAQALLDQAIVYSGRALRANRHLIDAKVSEQSSRWLPKWVDKMIADKVMDGLTTTLSQMRDPSHPWRIELKKTIEKLIDDLAHDPGLYQQGEVFKAELLASPTFIEQARTLWGEVESGLYEGIPAHADAIARACEIALRHAGEWLKADPERSAQLNRGIRIIAQRLLLPYRYQIGGYIERVVNDWDSATLVERLELQVGKDLQYIRINGTLVGGLVGLLIYIVSKWLTAL